MSSVASRVWMMTGRSQLAGQRELRREDRLLHVARREVVVVVEADLADRAGVERRGVGARDVRRRVGAGRRTSPALCGCTPVANRTAGHRARTPRARTASASSPADRMHSASVTPGRPARAR